jgi:hypothetical protein
MKAVAFSFTAERPGGSFKSSLKLLTTSHEVQGDLRLTCGSGDPIGHYSRTVIGCIFLNPNHQDNVNVEKPYRHEFFQ